MFKLFIIGGTVVTVGLVSSVLKRYTSYDSHTPVLDKLENEDVKHYVGKCFEASDNVVSKAEEMGGWFVSDKVKDAFKSDKKDKKD